MAFGYFTSKALLLYSLRAIVKSLHRRDASYVFIGLPPWPVGSAILMGNLNNSKVTCSSPSLAYTISVPDQHSIYADRQHTFIRMPEGWLPLRWSPKAQEGGSSEHQRLFGVGREDSEHGIKDYRRSVARERRD